MRSGSTSSSSLASLIFGGKTDIASTSKDVPVEGVKLDPSSSSISVTFKLSAEMRQPLKRNIPAPNSFSPPTAREHPAKLPRVPSATTFLCSSKNAGLPEFQNSLTSISEMLATDKPISDENMIFIAKCLNNPLIRSRDIYKLFIIALDHHPRLAELLWLQSTIPAFVKQLSDKGQLELFVTLLKKASLETIYTAWPALDKITPALITMPLKDLKNCFMLSIQKKHGTSAKHIWEKVVLFQMYFIQNLNEEELNIIFKHPEVLSYNFLIQLHESTVFESFLSKKNPFEYALFIFTQLSNYLDENRMELYLKRIPDIECGECVLALAKLHNCNLGVIQKIEALLGELRMPSIARNLNSESSLG